MRNPRPQGLDIVVELVERPRAMRLEELLGGAGRVAG
jgi:hypothetical protein